MQRLLRAVRCRASFGLALVALLCAGGCTVQSPRDGQRRAEAAKRQGLSGELWTQLLRYGAGARQVGLRPQRAERLANGVSAVAVAAEGDVLLLDRLNGRVLRLARAGASRVAARVPEDAVDFALGGGGTIAAFSALRARVWLYRAGEPVGELRVPRTLQQVQGLRVDRSNRVVLRTALQERFALGSPRAPQRLGQVLHSKREGAFALADGSALQVTLVDGAPQLLRVVRRPSDGRARVKRAIALPRRGVIAARIVGVAASTACLRLERRAARSGSRTHFEVQREALCVDVDSGAVVLARPLPAVGLYTPRRELALSSDGRTLAMIVAQTDGLRLRVWSLAGGAR